MKKGTLIFILLAILSLFGNIPLILPLVAPTDEQTAIIEDSEVGYTLVYHPGDLRSWNKGRPPDKNDYSAVCRKGTVSERILNQWKDGKTEVARQRRPTLKKYLRLWRILEECNVWSLESPMDVLMRIKSLEEDPYIVHFDDQEWWQFRFRIGTRVHHFSVYFIQGLKDKRYERILREMDRFLRVKHVKIRKMAVGSAYIK
ncbi:MAG: hypothetical protein IMZ57_11540 [Acidobacteria bacterium]|nr:hypothetical protein [Acidobacteriota bacterium]